MTAVETSIGRLTSQVAYQRGRADSLERTLERVEARVEALMADVEYSREHTGIDPTILCQDGQWADLQPLLRTVIGRRPSERREDS